MPEIGDIKEVMQPNGYSKKRMYYPCIDCGKERWVHIIRGSPETLRCHICAAKYSFTPEHKAAILAGSKRRWDKPGAKEHMKEKMSGVNNPFFGKRHTPEIQALIAI